VHGTPGGVERRGGRAAKALAGRSMHMTIPPPVVQTKPSAALRQSPIPALRKLTVEETDTTVVIHGSVASYYLKQLAQETLMPYLGGRQLLNRVAVVRPQFVLANN
jgi:hypothetical protein